MGSGEVSNPSYACLFGAYSAHLARFCSRNLVLALTLGLGAGEVPGQAERWRGSGVLELLVSGQVCVGCGLGRGELTKLCLLIQCSHS